MKAWDYYKRLDEIKRAKNVTKEGSYQLLFRGSLSDFNIYRVPIQMPVYRLSNGRTLARQKEFIAKNNKPDDYFSRDAESQDALDSQDEILFSLVEEEGLWDYFKNPKTVQNEPFILDENGYIINGNRRVCAMRRLLQADHSTYSKYEYIRVIFLENYSEGDIVKLEAQLQIDKDIKAAYSWITEALLYKQLLTSQRYDYGDLERIYNKKKSEIQLYIDMIEDVDEYLESRNWKNQYTKVENDKYAFQQLHTLRKGFKDSQDKEIFKQTVFRLLDNPEEAGDRLYKVVKDTADNLPHIKKMIIDEQIIEKPVVQATPSVATPKSSAATYYPLLASATTVEENKEEQINEKIISVLRDKQKSGEVREKIVQTLDLCNKAKKEGKSKNAFRNHLQTAHSNLIDAKTCFNDTSDITGALIELDNIEALLKEIKGLLK